MLKENIEIRGEGHDAAPLKAGARQAGTTPLAADVAA
jgi:hypothetical protein